MFQSEVLDGDVEKSTALIKPALTPMKQALVDLIMGEFWIIFNQEWTGNIQKRAGASSTPSPSTTPSSKGSGQKSNSNKDSKRPRDDNDEGDEHSREDERKGRKRRNNGSCPAERDNSLKYACPYRKHDPRKYCYRDWRSCALTAQETIARVKSVTFTLY